MKKHLSTLAVIALAAVLALSVSGCGTQPAAPTTAPTAAPATEPAAEPTSEPTSEPSQGTSAGSAAAVFEAYRAVLAGEAPFYSDFADAELYITDLLPATDLAEGNEVTASGFSVADVDADGVDDAVLTLSVNGDVYVCSIVLHCADGRVTGYTMGYRAMNGLKEDGTFFYSSGAADSGFGGLSFEDDGTCAIAPISWSEPANDGGVLFFVDGEISDEAGLAAAVESQNAKADATVYELTAENIAAAFSA